MTVSRRTFLASLVGILGAASFPDLEKKVLDRGRPILLPPVGNAQTLHIYEGGILTLGPDEVVDDVRPTWLEVLREEGVEVDNPAALRKVQWQRCLFDDELHSPVTDVCWPMVWGLTMSPTARAVRLLTDLNVGTTIRTKKSSAGRLDFHYGDNHPGSNDVWVDVRDDLSATLLQARLIELGQPIKVIMEVPTIQRDWEW